MYKARKNVEIKGKKRDIIEDYANFGSTVYAPITRDGLSLDKKAKLRWRITFQAFYLSTI